MFIGESAHKICQCVKAPGLFLPLGEKQGARMKGLLVSWLRRFGDKGWAAGLARLCDLCGPAVKRRKKICEICVICG